MSDARPARAVLSLALLIAGSPAAAQQPVEPHTLEPPRSYLVPRVDAPLRIDGRLDDTGWQAASWSEAFVDIEGSAGTSPALRTRMRMLWDDEHLYIAAELEEPHVWATLTERDAVIFHDDDFEVFIDPDGDTHAYYEIEVNALGTVWDLLLTRPYRDGGQAIDAWDVRGLQVGVHVDGSLNDPTDVDRGWSVELAIPWQVLAEAAPGGRQPRAGEQWRMNFSRVDWDVEVRDGRYVKQLDPVTGRTRAEHNRVWSPQGAVNMHMPERWGIVQFGGAASADGVVAPDPDATTKAAVRALYFAQRRYREAHGAYARTLGELMPPPDVLRHEPRLERTTSGYEITARGASGRTVHIREDGRQWTTESEDS